MTSKKTTKQIFYTKINMNINQCLDCKIKIYRQILLAHSKI